MNRILEIGSYDVNGSIRRFFEGADYYVGVDLKEGPGVDVVYNGRNLPFETLFDVTISCEVFEHDPFWYETFENMVKLTRVGGVVLFTCASRGRPEHGTQRTDPNGSPGTQAVGIDYYMNLEESDFLKRFNLGEVFSEHVFVYHKTICDLYFVGVKGQGGIDISKNKILEEVVKSAKEKIHQKEAAHYQKMPLGKRIKARLSRMDPIRFLLLLRSDDISFQNYLVLRRRVWSQFFERV